MIKIIEEKKEIVESTFWSIIDVKTAHESLRDEYQITLTDEDYWEVLKRTVDTAESRFECITESDIETELLSYIEEKLEMED